MIDSKRNHDHGVALALTFAMIVSLGSATSSYAQPAQSATPVQSQAIEPRPIIFADEAAERAIRNSSPTPRREEWRMPAEFRQNGMISSSTYQVFISLYATSEEEATRRGLSQAHEAAFQLILREPFVRRYLSQHSRQSLQEMIHEHATLVRVVAEDEGRLYSLSYQIRKPDMRNFLFRLR